jgi:hypothetical protein
VHCVRRPPFFEELAHSPARRPPFVEEHAGGAADGGLAPDRVDVNGVADGGLMAVEWRHAYTSAIAKCVNGSIPPRVLQRVSDSSDYRALMTMYDEIVRHGLAYLAVHVVGTLGQRMLVVCSARTYARLHGYRLLVIWPPDLDLDAGFTELFTPTDIDSISPHGLLVLSHIDRRLFPSQYWRQKSGEVQA